MSATGHSRPRQLAPKFSNVRFTPEAAKTLGEGEDEDGDAGEATPADDAEAPAKAAKKAKKKDEEA